MRLADATDNRTSNDTLAFYDRSSAYVWIFYSALVGAHAMACYCYLASLVEQGAHHVSWDHISEDLQIPHRDRFLDALCLLESASMVELRDGACWVRSKLPLIDAALEQQLPPRLRRIHVEARSVLPSTTTPAHPSSRPSSLIGAMRARARWAAVSLLRMGNSCEEVESRLSSYGYHPSLVSSAALWALWHLVATAREKILSFTGLASVTDQNVPPTTPTSSGSKSTSLESTSFKDVSSAHSEFGCDVKSFRKRASLE